MSTAILLFHITFAKKINKIIGKQMILIENNSIF